MKKRYRFSILYLLLFALLFSANALAAAPLTTAKSTASLKDVRDADEVSGTWETTSDGVKFLQENGKYVRNKWISYEGNIYYINKNRVRTTGWVIHNKKYYYLNKKGAMVTGWLNKKFYMAENGQRVTGPKKIDGDFYYFDTKTGKKKTGWITIKKKKYYYEPGTGKRALSKWIQSGKYWKYVNDKGVLQKSCWLQLGEKRYYVDAAGNRVTGEQYIGGKWYYFKKNGVYDSTKKVTTNIDPKKKMVALTFDDGPGPYTSSLLSCLKANKARATFFMVGSNVVRYKSVVKQMFAQHCELGNHSYTHPDFTRLSSAGIASEISRTDSAIKAACGQTATLVRLPYGSGHKTGYVLNAIKKPSIYWSIDTRDWEHTGSPQSTVNAVLNYVKNGDIVLMHDIHSASVTAAKTIIPALRNRGFQMVTVSELAKYKGKTSLKAGTTYYNFY